MAANADPPWIGGEQNDPGGGGNSRGSQFGYWHNIPSPLRSSSGSRIRGRPMPRSVFDNRRGLLLSAEQLAGPAAPQYLLRRPYVYSRQNLL